MRERKKNNVSFHNNHLLLLVASDLDLKAPIFSCPLTLIVDTSLGLLMSSFDSLFLSLLAPPVSSSLSSTVFKVLLKSLILLSHHTQKEQLIDTKKWGLWLLKQP